MAYIRDRQESYTDSANTFVGGQTVSLGQAEFGPEVSYTIRKADGTRWVPRAGLKGIWNFGEDNGAVAGTVSGSQDLRGKTEVGLTIADTQNRSLDFSAYYDGIGDNDFEAYSGSVRMRLQY